MLCLIRIPNWFLDWQDSALFLALLCIFYLQKTQLLINPIITIWNFTNMIAISYFLDYAFTTNNERVVAAPVKYNENDKTLLTRLELPRKMRFLMIVTAQRPVHLLWLSQKSLLSRCNISGQVSTWASGGCSSWLDYYSVLFELESINTCLPNLFDGFVVERAPRHWSLATSNIETITYSSFRY